jgi:hypothetical protein
MDAERFTAELATFASRAIATGGAADRLAAMALTGEYAGFGLLTSSTEFSVQRTVNGRPVGAPRLLPRAEDSMLTSLLMIALEMAWDGEAAE